jgi:hypothetical protein
MNNLKDLLIGVLSGTFIESVNYLIVHKFQKLRNSHIASILDYLPIFYLALLLILLSLVFISLKKGKKYVAFFVPIICLIHCIFLVMNIECSCGNP